MGKLEKICCVCGGPFSGTFDGKPYCNKHWLRMYTHGDLELRRKKNTNTHRVERDIAFITTANGVTFFVDEADLPTVKRYSWCMSKTGYPVANVGGSVVKLHRYLLRPESGEVVDHINGNRMDNRRCNLRVCTAKENARNVRPAKNSKSGVLGVRETKHGTYQARIVVNGTEIHLGNFKTMDEADSARRVAESQYFGEYSPSQSRSAVKAPEQDASADEEIIDVDAEMVEDYTYEEPEDPYKGGATND